ADRPRRQARGKAVAIGLRYGCNGLEPKRLACADHPDGNLATVGDQHALEAGHWHQRRPWPSGAMKINGWSNSTRPPFSATVLTTSRWTAARIELKSFITSIRHTVSSACTRCPSSTKGFSPGACAR